MNIKYPSYQAFLQGVWQIFYDKVVLRFMKFTRISLKLNLVLLYSTIKIKIWIANIVHSIHQRFFGWWFRYLSSFIVKFCWMFPDGVRSTSRLLQAVMTEKIVCPPLSVEIRSSSPVGRLTQRSSEVPVTYIAEMWPAGRKYVGCYRDSTVPACRCYTVKMLIRAWRLSLWRNNHPLSVAVVSKFLMGRSCLHQVCLCPWSTSFLSWPFRFMWSVFLHYFVFSISKSISHFSTNCEYAFFPPVGPW